MSVAIDANVLIYSLHDASPHHAAANRALVEVFSSGESVWLFPSVVVAILRVTTHPRLFPRPLTVDQAFSNLRRLTEIPSVHLGFAAEDFVERLAEVAIPADARGKLIHDAEIVALMRTHGVDRIVTADRDFSRFEGIMVTLLER